MRSISWTWFNWQNGISVVNLNHRFCNFFLASYRSWLSAVLAIFTFFALSELGEWKRVKWGNEDQLNGSSFLHRSGVELNGSQLSGDMSMSWKGLNSDLWAGGRVLVVSPMFTRSPPRGCWGRYPHTGRRTARPGPPLLQQPVKPGASNYLITLCCYS